MTKFQTLTPQQARKIEENAVRTADLTLEKQEVKNGQKEEVIFKVRSVFPFELFPDELIIKRDRVTLINKILPGSSMVRDMHLHDVAQAEADVGPIFGHLHVYPKLRTEEPLLIERIKKEDAMKARIVIENLIERVEPRSTY